VFGLRSALVFRNAPATEREFKVSRTALDLTFESSLTLNLAVGVGLPVVADRLPALRPVERAKLAPALGRA
jgi:hypothetical protein